MEPVRRLLGLVGLTMFAATVVALAGAAQYPKPTARQIRQKLLAELQPVALENCVLQRIGGPNDGGYLMCGNLLGNAGSAYSYGIGTDDEWGCEISHTLGVPVHQYDCFIPTPEPCRRGRSIYHDECIGPVAEVIDGRTFDSLTSQIRKNGDAGRTLVVKIDVEGAELSSLLATPDRVLARIDQMAMEIHATDRRALDLVRKLKRTFHLVHLHFNNQACGVRFDPLPAWAYQVLFVNRRIAVVDPAAASPALPNPLDAPDYGFKSDCQAIGPIEP